MTAPPPSAVVFIDKDGTLVVNDPYNVDPQRIVLASGADDAMQTFAGAGLELVVVTNQPGIAFGRYKEAAMGPVRDRIAELIAPYGVRLRGFFYCPHHPLGTVERYSVQCACRKPECGLVIRAKAELNVDLARSWMVGDILDDIEAGARAGCRTVLVDNGGETEWLDGEFRRPNLVVPDLAAAARAIATWPGRISAPAGDRA
jgi:D,D-heptose 1,7-bisphosphate phosphatase